MKYLGTIDNAGSDVKNNATASVPFSIPPGVHFLVVVPSSATLLIACSRGAASGAGDSSFLPAATDMMPLDVANKGYGIACIPGGTLACRKSDAAAGTLKVFAVRGI